jgi:hypothetical protein
LSFLRLYLCRRPALSPAADFYRALPDGWAAGPAAATAFDGAVSSLAYFFLASSIQALNACSLTTWTSIGMKA